MEKIAFFGIGIMGLPISINLLNAGYDLYTIPHNPNNPNLIQFESNGGHICNTFRETLVNTKYVISILSNDDAVNEFYSNKDFVNNIDNDAIIIEMTSSSHLAIENIINIYKDTNIKIIDAPVSGGVKGAIDRTLTIMCAGDMDAYNKVLPILKTIGSKYDLLSNTPGMGKKIKAINQMMVGIYKLASAEALQLALHNNIDINTLLETLMSSSGGHPQLPNDFKSMPLDIDPNIFFTLENLTKDINNAYALSQDINLPMLNTLKDIFNKANINHSKENCTAVYKAYVE